MRWGSVLVVSLLLCGRPAYAQDAFWDFLPHAPITACPEDSSANTDARQQLDRVGERIEALNAADAPGDALDLLSALLRTECFFLAAESPRLPHPDSTTSLQEWWRNGGQYWLESYLDPPLLGLIQDLRPHVVVPPDTRTTFDIATAAHHPLARYLCAPGDNGCGAETRGWRMRAESAFENHRARGRHTIDEPGPFDYTTDHATQVSDSCTDLGARGAWVAGDYARWRACVEQHRFTRTALPLGAIRSPTSGWLIVEGRRGHYEFCDTVRAFDLSTGAAFASDSCSGLALRGDGSVDRAATNARRENLIRHGTVSVAHLREAAWMMLLRGETAEVQLSAQTFPVPHGLRPELPGPPAENAPEIIRGAPFSTAQTSLTWRLVQPDGTALSGDVTWPESFDAADDHAAALLGIAEQGFIEGCAGKAPPPSLVRSHAQPLDDDLLEDADALLAQHYVEAARSWRSLRACRIARRP